MQPLHAAGTRSDLLFPVELLGSESYRLSMPCLIMVCLKKWNQGGSSSSTIIDKSDDFNLAREVVPFAGLPCVRRRCGVAPCKPHEAYVHNGKR